MIPLERVTLPPLALDPSGDFTGVASNAGDLVAQRMLLSSVSKLSQLGVQLLSSQKSFEADGSHRC